MAAVLPNLVQLANKAYAVAAVRMDPPTIAAASRIMTGFNSVDEAEQMIKRDHGPLR
jgi:hypothetical protein